MLPRRLLALSCAALLAACQAGPASVKAPARPKPATNPKVVGSPTAPPAGGGLIAANQGGIVSNNGGAVMPIPANALAGVVRAPASLIANNGGGLVSNNGGSLITDNGAGLVGDAGGAYHLAAAPEQTPVVGVVVTLLDAAGAPVKDAAGQPLRATTGADGRFAFPTAPTGRAVVAAVELPGGKGALQALVAADAARGSVDVDFVSTLTTRYILAKYVAPQAEPLAVIERLPGGVEAETRKAAAAALATGAVPVPAALTAEAAVGAVEALRKADGALDRQLEVVRELLVVAGQSDLGAGQVATEAALGDVTGLAVAADGTTYVVCGKDYRIWRVGPDGKLATHAGTGKRDVGPTIGGQRALEAGLAFPRHLTLDPEGRLLFLDGPTDVTKWKTPPRSRLDRLGADGVIADLWPDLGEGLAAFPAADGAVHVLHAEGEAAALAWVADGAAVDATTYPSEVAALAARATCFGLDADRRLYLGVPGADGATIRRVDAAGAVTVVAQEGQGGVASLALAPDGRVVLLEAAGAGRRLAVLAPDGTRTVIAASVGVGFELRPLAQVAFGPDGALTYVVRGNQVHRLAQGGADAPVAGRAERLTAGSADVALISPAGLVAGADGTLWFADKYAHRVYRRDPAGAVAVVAGVGGDANGDGSSTGDGGPATAAGLDQPRALRRDAAGNLYVLEIGARVRKIDAAGTITRAWKAAAGQYIRDFALAPDGTAYFSYKASGGDACSVVAVKPDGTETPILPATPIRGVVIGTAADGTLHLVEVEKEVRRLRRWTAADGLETLVDALPFDLSMPNDSNGLAVDARGRVIITRYDHDDVWLWDPATKAATAIAGEGGARFAGAGVDGSLSSPRYPAIAPNGDLYLSDTQHKQVKRIPAGEY